MLHIKKLGIPSALLIFITIPISHASTEEIQRNFKVSAYYSPVANQQEYVSGSYKIDLEMNGNGTHGADGTPVYVGMLSAPSKYEFGTTIEIPGFGIGIVHDRGGGIFAGKDYDKLDIWMGSGDEGRIRAINWGSQLVTGKILNASDSTIERIKSEYEEKFFSESLWENKQGMTKENIVDIQRFLRREKFFEDRISGIFTENTTTAIYEFQQEHNIVQSRTDDGAGYWGPKTRAKANTIHEEKYEKKTAVTQVTTQVTGEVVTMPEPIEKKNFSIPLEKGDENDEVQEVQKFLATQNFFSGETTEYFGLKTFEAVYQFQKHHNIVSSKNDIGAGEWGPKTRAKANGL